VQVGDALAKLPADLIEHVGHDASFGPTVSQEG
jgi:hypothetical protein